MPISELVKIKEGVRNGRKHHGFGLWAISGRAGADRSPLGSSEWKSSQQVGAGEMAYKPRRKEEKLDEHEKSNHG